MGDSQAVHAAKVFGHIDHPGNGGNTPRKGHIANCGAGVPPALSLAAGETPAPQ
jgi:hypothetical protein